MTPLVSILIPVHNGEAWVDASIRSALAQSWPSKEVIVLDDGSTDRTLGIIGRFHPHIRIETGPRRGQNLARNHLVELSRGEWLVFLDADDELAADSVEQKMQVRDADVIYGTMEVATFGGAIKSKSYISKAIDYADIWEAAFDWRLPNTTAMMLRREALLAAGGWPIGLSRCTDYGLYFRLLFAQQRFRPAPHALSLYRQWSNTQQASQNPTLSVLTKLDLIWWAAEKLVQAGAMTPQRLKSWSDQTLRSIRLLNQHDKSLVALHLERLRKLNPGYRPRSPAFSHGYGVAYSCLGFDATEWLARAVRPWRHSY
jgi:glycosyltransferase involved in cell wall biosynthesis